MIESPSDSIVRASDLVDDVIAYMLDQRERVDPHVERVRAAQDWRERLNALRALYAVLTPDEIRSPTFCGYDLGLWDLFTPIERSLWESIRGARLAAVPQYPVGPYVVDFAVVEHRIAIEADGRGYHDQVKDAARDDVLYRKHGWRVFRLEGHECVRVCEAPQEARERLGGDSGDEPVDEALAIALWAFYATTACGLVRAIKTLLIDGRSGHEDFDWMARSLDSHRLAQFTIEGCW